MIKIILRLYMYGKQTERMYIISIFMQFLIQLRLTIIDMHKTNTKCINVF